MYVTKQNMIDRFGEENLIELTDRVEPYISAIVDQVLDQALNDASAVADSYISRRYDLPLAAIPPVLIIHTAALAYYDLHRGRYSDEVRTDRDDAVKFLRDISEGKALLDASGNEPESAPADARVEAPERIFNRDELKVF